MIWLEIAWINKTHWERVRFLIGCENKQMPILTTRLQPISTSNHSETVETVLGWDSSIAVTSHIPGFFQGRMGDFFNHLKTWCPLWSSSQTWLNIKTISNQPKNYVLRKIHHLQNLQLEILQCNVSWTKAQSSRHLDLSKTSTILGQTHLSCIKSYPHNIYIIVIYIYISDNYRWL